MTEGFIEVVAEQLKAAAHRVLTEITVGNGASDFVAEPDLPLVNEMLANAEQLANLLEEEGAAPEAVATIRENVAVLENRYGPPPYSGAHLPRERIKYDVALDMFQIGTKLAGRVAVPV